ncbi:hypothetical protein B0H13DRAFT_2418236 [Mycena leptocephala]|nr:hypothetical protein B0H13DRAFT_2418236 [Mycena leptocephala]
MLIVAFSNAALPTVTALSVTDTLHTILPAFQPHDFRMPHDRCPQQRARPARTHFPRLNALVGLRLNEGEEVFIAVITRDFPVLYALSVSSVFISSSSGTSAFADPRELALLYYNEWGRWTNRSQDLYYPEWRGVRSEVELLD